MVVSDGGQCLSDRHYVDVYLVLHAYLYQVTLAFLLPVSIVFICNISVLRKICQVNRNGSIIQVTYRPRSPVPYRRKRETERYRQTERERERQGETDR